MRSFGHYRPTPINNKLAARFSFSGSFFANRFSTSECIDWSMIVFSTLYSFTFYNFWLWCMSYFRRSLVCNIKVAVRRSRHRVLSFSFFWLPAVAELLRTVHVAHHYCVHNAQIVSLLLFFTGYSSQVIICLLILFISSVDDNTMF